LNPRTNLLMISTVFASLVIDFFLSRTLHTGYAGSTTGQSSFNAVTNRDWQTSVDDGTHTVNNIAATAVITEPQPQIFLPLIRHNHRLPIMGDWIRIPGPNLPPGVSGSWDDAAVSCPTVLHAGSQYQMWYTGREAASGKSRLGYATSQDGYIWEKYATNPVLHMGAPGSWDESQVSDPAILFDGSTWKLWYSGYSESSGLYQIGYATSPNGIAWTKFPGNPILSQGPPGSWDENGPRQATVLFRDGAYHMWYASSDGNRGHIGYATSSDGIHWQKYAGNPVIDPPGDGQEITREVESPYVFADQEGFQMWYHLGIYELRSPYFSRIFHKVSSDGVAWSNGTAHLPQIIPGPFGRDECPTIVTHDDSVRMWYSGKFWIDLAEAPLEISEPASKIGVMSNSGRGLDGK
jgi:predicted GH43/DUF377 family glycosyl hydrolase